MENSRFLDCLAADFARIRAIVPDRLIAAVADARAIVRKKLGEVVR